MQNSDQVPPEEIATNYFSIEPPKTEEEQLVELEKIKQSLFISTKESAEGLKQITDDLIASKQGLIENPPKVKFEPTPRSVHKAKEKQKRRRNNKMANASRRRNAK